jgi:hypothetical protein
MKRPHKYLADPIDVASEAPVDYRVEDGVLVDITERPTARKAYDDWTRYWQPSPEDRKAEEAAWAAKSGPCVIINPGRKTA